MPRQDLNTIAHTSAPGNRNQRVAQLVEGQPQLCEFEFDQRELSDDQRVRIIGRDTGSGDRLIRLTYRPVDSNRNSAGFDVAVIPDDWEIDLGDTIINTAVRRGGRVDGSSLLADRDYLIWAFFDPWDSAGDKFKGMGITLKPEENYTAKTIAPAGNKGTSCDYTVPSGAGFSFVVGSRVLVRHGTALADAYNYGTVTAHTSTVVSVDMDNDAGYGQDITSATGDIIQVDKFEPRMRGQDSLYPGSGSEYSFAYMGSLHTDSSSLVFRTRKRGDFYWFPDIVTIHSSVSKTVTGNETIEMGKWVPFHTRDIRMEIQMGRSAGSTNNNNFVVWSSASNSAPRIATANVGAETIRATDTIPPLVRDCSLYYTWTVGASTTVLITSRVFGYRETRF